VAVFVDGAFWHGHPSRHRPGRSGRYWDDKIAGNVARDHRVNIELREIGFVVIRVWDFEVRKMPLVVVDGIARALAQQIVLRPSSPTWQRQLVRRHAE
jgi:DNA mismatch endonuclease (patch repair protein)